MMDSILIIILMAEFLLFSPITIDMGVASGAGNSIYGSTSVSFEISGFDAVFGGYSLLGLFEVNGFNIIAIIIKKSSFLSPI